MATRDLGNLKSDPKSINNDTLTTGDPNDVYKFKIKNTRNINLSLHDISFDDDADLQLYRDRNGNGRLDSTDKLVASSINGKFENGVPKDDSINVQGKVNSSGGDKEFTR